jgi:hypothetical protein
MSDLEDDRPAWHIGISHIRHLQTDGISVCIWNEAAVQNVEKKALRVWWVLEAVFPRSRHATGGARRDPDMPLAAPAAIPTCHWRRPPRSRHATGGARRDPDMPLAAQRKLVPPRSRYAAHMGRQARPGVRPPPGTAG